MREDSRAHLPKPAMRKQAGFRVSGIGKAGQVAMKAEAQFARLLSLALDYELLKSYLVPGNLNLPPHIAHTKFCTEGV